MAWERATIFGTSVDTARNGQVVAAGGTGHVGNDTRMDNPGWLTEYVQIVMQQELDNDPSSTTTNKDPVLETFGSKSDG